MFEIQKKVGEDWVCEEQHTQSLEDVLIRILEIEKINPDEIYRLEEITELGKKVINFKN
jgi:hypothetical protein